MKRSPDGETGIRARLKISFSEKGSAGSIPALGTEIPIGELAQLARASALHAEGQRFDSVILHIWKTMIRCASSHLKLPISVFQNGLVAQLVSST